MVTIFRSIRDTDTPFYRDIMFVLERIKDGVHKDTVAAIRAEEDKKERNTLKQKLPAICFSGEFIKRADDSIKSHSGYICLDFDGYDTKKKMLAEKKAMVSDPYVFSVFISPSGKGLKTIVKIPKDAENHKRYFDALKAHFSSDYFDTTSKNVSRVCYESYDPKIHINEDSKVWEDMAEHEYDMELKSNVHVGIPINDDDRKITILRSWWDTNYGFVDGERNNNLFILASAFNDYGVSKSMAEGYMMQFVCSDFPSSEVRITVNSAYRNVNAYGSKFFEDERKMHEVKRQLNKGATKNDIVNHIDGVDSEVLSNIIDNVAKDSTIKRFWNKNKKNVVSIEHHMFKDFLEQEGYYKYAQFGSQDYSFVKVTNNLIDIVTVEEIKDFILGYIRETNDMDVYNHFADKTRYFTPSFLNMVDTVRVHFIADSRYCSFIYFLNCAVKVTRDDISMVDYVDLDGYIWRNQVIERNFDYCSSEHSPFRKFVSNISGGNDNRINSLESTIGYLMSSYKDPGYCPAVILNDEVITDNPEGGTGKGIFVQSLAHLKKVVKIDGKAFTFDSNFAYQNVESDTQLLCFDDTKKNFDFERLFSVITEGITVEKKGIQSFTIPFDDSPKIIITTNYAIKGKGNSFERRKWELEFKQHYTKTYTPVDEFGKRFFDDWSEDEWCAFDNYMINNLQFYLNEGLVVSDFQNLDIRKLGAETCQEFLEWTGVVNESGATDKLKFNKRLFKDQLYNEFIQDNPDYAPRAKMTISRQKFYKWLISYGEFLDGVTFEEGRDRDGRWIMFIKNEEEAKERRDDTELQF